MKICVFCSSSNAVAESYFAMATELGQIIQKNGHALVYGGANVGLMEQVASTVKTNGGEVIGIIPQKIHDRALSSDHPDELIITSTMAERKMLMHEKSDAFIALPGGFGTLEEILEVITLKQLDYHQKPIVFINTNGFFDHIFNQFEHSYSEGFAKENYRKLYQIVASPNEAIDYIQTYKHEVLGTKWFTVPEK
ncbi:MAG: TIGR00730 family Rossman fold protein [Prolixibacteraceae bacterium]